MATAFPQVRGFPSLTYEEILCWLRESDSDRLAELWLAADQTRRQCVGDEVHLRGLIEFSNHCARCCAYCGLRAPNRRLKRYRMSAAEILACAGQAVWLGYGTVVLQSGEDDGMPMQWMVDLIARIKAETTLAITLSLGERSEVELAAWRAAGADLSLIHI